VPFSCANITSVPKRGDKVNNDTRSRKWQLTINNPVEKGLIHEELKLRLSNLKQLVYWCMADEVGGEEGTYHTHIYIAFSNAVRFSTLKTKFEVAHFEMARGTSQENKDYVFKEGKWFNDKKGDTNLRDTHEEYGEMPVERQGARNDLNDLYDMIKQGMSNYDILEENPSYLLNMDKVERARQIVRENQFKDNFRDVEVVYVFGETGTGKTRGVMETYGYSNVFRVTDYEHPFDGYKGQDVIAFEEFRSSLKIQDMLNYLDGYPLELPCRYANKIACYTKVYLISNVDLKCQYESIQTEHRETWHAFLRRIKKVVEYTRTSVTTTDTEKYLNPSVVLNTQGTLLDDEFDKMFLDNVFV